MTHYYRSAKNEHDSLSMLGDQSEDSALMDSEETRCDVTNGTELTNLNNKTHRSVRCHRNRSSSGLQTGGGSLTDSKSSVPL